MDNIKELFLTKEFGSRVSFRKTERKLYGHDVAAIPNLIKPLIGDTVPDAVVQPVNEVELVKLVKWAAESGVSLTPRGKATAGYGGVLPVKKGLVVDFSRMDRVINIDPAAMTATVQAGVVWERLDKALVSRGLTLRLYPSSYPSSTVGGWLAQGGAGIGSYEMGWFRDNVVSATAVLPDGTVREFRDSELDLISDAEGITGLISSIVLRIQPLEEMDVVAIGCPDSAGLQQLMQLVVDSHLPVWSLLFINPRMAELKNKIPLMEHNGHVVEQRATLPESYILTVTFRKKDISAVKDRLLQFAGECHGQILSDEIAQEEWDRRFKLMAVKRLGPSLVPSEVVVPLSSLDRVITEVERNITQPIVKEAIVVRKDLNSPPEVVILGFIPSDQRKFSYNFVFGLALSVFKVAEKYGGRPYSTGLYWSTEANKVLGTDRVKKLKLYKSEIDPRDILNPGKVIGSRMVGRFISLARTFEPVINVFGNRAKVRIGERPDKAIRGIPADVAWYAYSCSQCGYCIDECNQYYGRFWESQSPRGKWYWLREYMEGREQWDQAVVDSFLACTTCEVCNNRCSASLPIEPSWMKLRGQLINDKKKMTFPPFEMMSAALTREGDIWAGYRKDRDNWFPAEFKEKHGPGKKASAVYFAGCTASYVEKDIAMATTRLLDAAGVDFTYLGNNESCCGTPMMVAGKWDVFAEVMKKNIAAVVKSGADTVITSCPACDMMWRQVYPRWALKLGINFQIKTRHYSEVISDKLKSGEFKFPAGAEQPSTVTWHDSCHMGRASGIYDAPRELIKAIPGVNLVEMDYNREKAHCCGSVLTLIKEPLVAADVGKIRLDEVEDAGAEKVLALCPCCEFQLRVSAEKKKSNVEVVDLARFAASSLGYSFPDPNPEVQKQWAVFEGMIKLMSPQGFADLMGTMWPEMIDAMPFHMGLMMRLMGKIPGALNLMKPMFPVLFPRLLPMMMPRLMPVMLKKVAELIPMPDYMEQQMPDLMPRVMDNLMPQMIGDVVPLVIQPMINYLHGKNN